MSVLAAARRWPMLVAAALVLLTTGCTSSAVPPVAVEVTAAANRVNKNAEQELDAIAKAMQCQRQEQVLDDMYFYDGMSGVNCYGVGDEVAVVRVYDHLESVGQTIPDWLAGTGGDEELIAGDGWFALGPKSMISKALAAAPDGAPVRQPLPEPLPLTLKQEEINTCVRFMTGLIAEKVEDEKQYDAQIVHLDEEYPGMRAQIEGIFTSEEMNELQRALDEGDSLAFEETLTRFGATVKGFCS